MPIPAREDRGSPPPPAGGMSALRLRPGSGAGETHGLPPRRGALSGARAARRAEAAC